MLCLFWYPYSGQRRSIPSLTTSHMHCTNVHVKKDLQEMALLSVCVRVLLECTIETTYVHTYVPTVRVCMYVHTYVCVYMLSYVRMFIYS